MRFVGVLIAFGFVAAACSSFGGDDPGSGGPGANGGADGGPDGIDPVMGSSEEVALAFAPLVGTQAIIQGRSTTLPIALTKRGAELNGAIKITVSGLPEGVTAEALTLDGTAGNLVFSATPTSVQGAADAVIEATIGTHKATTPLKAFVRGAPGALDTTWGNGGHVLVYTEATGNGTADLVLGKNDDVYSLSGSVGVSGAADNHVVHLDKAGAIDGAYGTAGVASASSVGPTAAALGADGRFFFVTRQPTKGFGAVALSADGRTTDFNFSTDKSPGSTTANDTQGAYAVAIRGTDGHLFVGFDDYDYQNFGTLGNYCGITHLDSAGAPVTSFAGGAEQTARNSSPVGVLLQSGGAFAVLSVQAGFVDYARYNADTGAAVDGTPKTVAIPGVHRSNVGAAGLVVLADESVVAPFNGSAGLYLLKLDVNGNPVGTFGTAGLGGPYAISGAALAMGISTDANGRILVALDTGGIIRFTTTGDLDLDFGNGGLAPTETSLTSLHRRVIVQKDGGRILASGQGASQTAVTVSAYWP